jgi:hypothetical protein
MSADRSFEKTESIRKSKSAATKNNKYLQFVNATNAQIAQHQGSTFQH